MAIRFCLVGVHLILCVKTMQWITEFQHPGKNILVNSIGGLALVLTGIFLAGTERNSKQAS